MFPGAPTLTLQTIPPPAAHLCLTVENFVQKELGHSLHHKKLLIGFSGGIDSTALLLIFFLLAQRNNLSVAAAHLNHGMRPEAKRDEEFCRSLCARLSVPFFTEFTDVPAMSKNGTGLEDAARTARYAFFASLHPSYHYDYLLTGHHLNDLAEDCFMRLLRGSGWPSLAGMPAYTQHRSQLRPLLMQSKEALANFLLELDIPHVVDATNADPFTLRNRVRQQVLPFFLKENPRFLERIAALWKQARTEEEDINQLLTPIFEATSQALSLAEYPSDSQSNSHADSRFDTQHDSKQALSSHAQGNTTQNCPKPTSPLPPTPSPLGAFAKTAHSHPPVPACTGSPAAIVVLRKDQIENLPKSLRLRAYKHILDTLGPGQVLAETLLKLDTAWTNKKGKSLFQFSHGKTAQIDKQSIVFKKTN